jgi:hypothetical protein
MIPADVSSGNYASDPSATQRYGKEKTTLMLLRKKGARNRNGTSVDIVWTTVVDEVVLGMLLIQRKT